MILLPVIQSTVRILNDVIVVRTFVRTEDIVLVGHIRLAPIVNERLLLNHHASGHYDFLLLVLTEQILPIDVFLDYPP